MFLMRIDTIRCCTGSATLAICQDGSAESLYGADLGLWLLHGNCSATLGERASEGCVGISVGQDDRR